MYTVRNFKTKKALKEAVQAYREGRGNPVQVFQPGPFATTPEMINGRVSLEGPHYPEPHRWYATATVSNGIVEKVS